MNIDAEIRATRGTILGEAAWRRLALERGIGAKDPAYDDEREQFVKIVGGALAVMDEAGFDGLEIWLQMEESHHDD